MKTRQLYYVFFFIIISNIFLISLSHADLLVRKADLSRNRFSAVHWYFKSNDENPNDDIDIFICKGNPLEFEETPNDEIKLKGDSCNQKLTTLSINRFNEIFEKTLINYSYAIKNQLESANKKPLVINVLNEFTNEKDNYSLLNTHKTFSIEEKLDSANKLLRSIQINIKQFGEDTYLLTRLKDQEALIKDLRTLLDFNLRIKEIIASLTQKIKEPEIKGARAAFLQLLDTEALNHNLESIMLGAFFELESVHCGRQGNALFKIENINEGMKSCEKVLWNPQKEDFKLVMRTTHPTEEVYYDSKAKTLWRPVLAMPIEENDLENRLDLDVRTFNSQQEASEACANEKNKISYHRFYENWYLPTIDDYSRIIETKLQNNLPENFLNKLDYLAAINSYSSKNALEYVFDQENLKFINANRYMKIYARCVYQLY
jgi:hypothetical protein